MATPAAHRPHPEPTTLPPAAPATDRTWSPPTAQQAADHLAAHRPAPPPPSQRLAPVVVLAAAAAAALLIGGPAWALPWLALAGVSVRARAMLKRYRSQQRRIVRAHELVRLRFNRPALRTAWRLLSELTSHPSQHHAAVAVLAQGLEQTGEVDAALVCLDHLAKTTPANHPAQLDLDARRTAALVASGRLADADAALRRLRSAPLTTAKQRATLALAELEHAVATAHYREAIDESPALIADLRPLGLNAAHGYALRAVCHHHRAAAGDAAAARWWWDHATALLDAQVLTAALPAARALAPALPPVAGPHAEPIPPASNETNLDAPRPDPAPNETGPTAPDLTPRRLHQDRAADRWLRGGLLVGLPAGVLTAGLLTAWSLPVATVSAVVILIAASGALFLLQAPVVAGLPAVATLAPTAPGAALTLLRRLNRRRGLAPPLRHALYHAAATLAHRRGTPADRAAAAALAAELLNHGPEPDTSNPAAAVQTAPPRAALLLILADGHLAAGRPQAAFPALAALAHTAVTLDQGLERLVLHTRYALAMGHHAAALDHAKAKADLGALMPAIACRRLHRDLLTAAQYTGDPAAAWLAPRVALLG